MTMNKLTRTSIRGVLALALVIPFIAACGDDDPTLAPDGPPTVKPKTYRQVEHLARPGISEALLISNDYLAGYNATAPSFAGVDQATLGLVVGEAKTVLKALYLGVCLLDGTVTPDPAAGLKPGGIQCPVVGANIFTNGMLDGTTVTPAMAAAAQQYADKVFDQFVPDVMRVDMGVTPSTYLSLCGDANSKPLLCGGRFVNNDVIDITYNYLLAGAAITKGPFDQIHALVSDGVNFSLDPTKNVGNVLDPVATNPSQGHPDITTGFPYSAPPL
jgi:hypothetical protein